MIPANLLPEGTRWCIAGGFAACPALAGDIDVWVYGVKTDRLQVRRAELLLHLAEQDFHIATESGDNVQSEDYEREDGDVSILKVGRVGIGRGNGNMPVHVMVTDAKAPLHLLQHFDISTHAIAIDYSGSVVKHPKWTPTSVPPVAFSQHTTTQERLDRIAERYAPERYGHEDKEIPF